MLHKFSNCFSFRVDVGICAFVKTKGRLSKVSLVDLLFAYLLFSLQNKVNFMAVVFIASLNTCHCRKSRIKMLKKGVLSIVRHPNSPTPR